MKLVPDPITMDENAGTTVITGNEGLALTSTGVMPRVDVMATSMMDNGIESLGFFRFFIRIQH